MVSVYATLQVALMAAVTQMEPVRQLVLLLPAVRAELVVQRALLGRHVRTAFAPAVLVGTVQPGRVVLTEAAAHQDRFVATPAALQGRDA